MCAHKAVPDSSRWDSVRRALVEALDAYPHRKCFLHAVGSVLGHAHGRAALQFRGGNPAAAKWQLPLREHEPSGIMPRLGRRRFHCDDAELWGLHDLIFDAVETGELEIPEDTSVLRQGEEVPADASVSVMVRLCSKWQREAVRWSEKRGAGAAFVIVVKDRRLVWVGVHVTRGPTAGLEQPRAGHA